MTFSPVPIGSINTVKMLFLPVFRKDKACQEYDKSLLNALPRSRLDSAGMTGGIQAEKRQRRHKKRPVRLPKNYQPGVMPDPDRWLPRRERAGYRGKRRNKRQINLRGPQGQVSGGTEW